MTKTLLLNRYELLEKIGEGGMGIVYKAKCSLLNRFVAVKILKSELASTDEFIDRFKREANSIANLSCPNIVSVYDVGLENNVNFIVMEYIDGKTLKQIIKENVRLSPLKTLEISMQIANALNYAHKSNIIHRDIKPDNILITDDNIVKLMDFGIAKVADSNTITNSSKVIGSVHYFSPEQAKGNFVDQRTDIYALGIVMYEMITGQVPFKGDTSISVAMMHIQKPIIPPQEIVNEIPENINKIILKALKKNPINRFQTSEELLTILNLIKDNLNLKIDFDANLTDTAKTVIHEGNMTLSDTDYDFTLVMNEEILPKTILLEDAVKKTSKKSDIKKYAHKNKRLKLIAGFVFSFIFVAVLAIYLFQRDRDNTLNKSIMETDTEKTAIDNNYSPKESLSTQSVEKQLVPSLKGKTQDIAEKIIGSNNFSLGNITSEYSDTVPKGSIISQSPDSDTYYEQNGQINLVVSQGQKANQIVSQTKQNGNNNGNANGKDKENKLKKEKNNK